MSTPEINDAAPTHAATPLETFRKVRSVLGSLPHDQVSQLIQEVDASTRGISFPEPVAPEPEPEPGAPDLPDPVKE